VAKAAISDVISDGQGGHVALSQHESDTLGLNRIFIIGIEIPVKIIIPLMS
jgi:hypothetical protein